MINITAIFVALANLNFVGEFFVTNNGTNTYFCLCGYNNSSIIPDNETQVIYFRTEMGLSGNLTMNRTIIDLSEESLIYQCQSVQLYQYLLGFITAISFTVGLYLNPAVIWDWITRIQSTQLSNWITNYELRIRNQL